MHRLRRDPLRDISRKSKPPSAWIQGRNTRHSVRCVRARTNVRAVRRELRSHSSRSVGASSHSIKCCAIELHQVSLRLTRHSSETSLRGLVVLDASGYYDRIRESQKCLQHFHWNTAKSVYKAVLHMNSAVYHSFSLFQSLPTLLNTWSAAATMFPGLIAQLLWW